MINENRVEQTAVIGVHIASRDADRGGMLRQFRFAQAARRARRSYYAGDGSVFERTYDPDWLRIKSHSIYDGQTLRSMYCRNAATIMCDNACLETKRLGQAAAQFEPRAIAVVAAIFVCLGLLAYALSSASVVPAGSGIKTASAPANKAL